MDCYAVVARHPRPTTSLNQHQAWRGFLLNENDPSAGSPTDTLLRLLLPLSGRARLSFLTTRLETQGIEANADESEGLARSFNR